MRKFALATAVALLFTVSASAQILTGTISGSVADPSGQRVPNATVKLTGQASGEQRTTTTNETGDFVFPGLNPGAYTIRVEATGFRPLERRDNNLDSAARLAVGTLQLEVGTLAESVTVTAEGTPVATTTTDNLAVLNTKQVSMISIRGRDPITMLRLFPGTSQERGQTDLFGGAFSTEVPTFQGGGGHTVYVDGVNGGDAGGGGRFSGATNLDAISELNVQMSNYTAQYGLKGGSQINFITKRGGEQFHGTGYWYKRHEMFNATNFFNNLSGIRKPIYRYQTLGANIGGRVPVKIPILNPTGHELFFFYSIDDTQAKDPSVSSTASESGGIAQTVQRWTFPTSLERAGNFSQSVDLGGKQIVVRDPLNNNAPFTNNVIPSNRANANSIAIMNILPLPNCSTCTGYNWVWQENALPKPRRQHLYRFDLRPTQKDSISIKHQTWYTKSVGINVAANASAWGLVPLRYDFTADMANISYTRIISPSIVNELGMGVFYSTETGPFANAAAEASMKRVNRNLGTLGQIAPENNPMGIIPRATWNGIPTSYVAASINYDGRTILTGADTALPINDTLTYIRGAHTIKAGALREFEMQAQARSGNFGGTFAFQHDSNDPLSTGYAFANSYIGHIRQYTEDLGRTGQNGRQHTYAFFAQDTWKVHRTVTLDIGLRFYKWSPRLNGANEASSFTFERFDPTWGGKPPVLFTPTLTAQGRRAQNPLTGEIVPATFIGLMVPGTGYSCTKRITGKSPCLINGIVTQKDPTYLGGKMGFVDWLPLQWDPRFGLAWDVFGDGKMAIRTSFGAYHDAMNGGSYLNEGGPAYTFPSSVYYTDMNSFLTAGSSATSPISVTGYWRQGQKSPVKYQYTFGIQRELGWQTVLDVAYVGNNTHHNMQGWNFDMLPQGVRFRPQSQDPTAPGKPLLDAFLYPITGFSGITMRGPATTNRYDSLQVQLNRRFAGGLELGGNYTYASGFNNGWYQQLTMKNHSRANNQTHVFNFSYVVDIPSGSKLTKVAWTKWVLDNWQASGVTTFASGFPLNVGFTTTDNFDFTGGGESCGIVQTGNALLPHGERTRLRFFDTSVFHRPSGRGDIGNNCANYKVRGPGYNNWDMSFFKNFPVREGKVIQLRWEMYNAFNHTQFKTLNNTARFDTAGNQVNTGFGSLTDANPERRMQMSLRFNF